MAGEKKICEMKKVGMRKRPSRQTADFQQRINDEKKTLQVVKFLEGINRFS